MKCYAKKLTPLETTPNKRVVPGRGRYFSATTLVCRVGGVTPEHLVLGKLD